MGKSKGDKKNKAPRLLNKAGNDSESELESAEESEVESVSDFQESDDDRCSTPESQKDTKCSVCLRNVNSSDKSLQCDKCNEWCHIKCGGVTKEHYKQMVQLDESNIEIQWHCPPCEKLQAPEKATTDVAEIEPQAVPAKAATLNNKTKPTQQVITKVKTSVAATLNSHIPRPGPTPPLVQRPTPQKPQRVVIQKKPVGVVMAPATVRVPVTQNGKQAAGRLSFPDCKIRDLPFFPVKSTLLRPCNLTAKDSSQEAQQQNLAFYLTQEQANTVNNGRKVEANGMVVYKMHILLRFTKKSPDNFHDDDFPKNLCLKVNNKICPLPNPKPVPANRPNMEAKRPPKPLIVTSLCKLNTKSCLNQISITWSPSDVTHTVSIYLVEKLAPADLLGYLKNRGMRDPEITKALIRSKLEDKDQDEIATTSCKVTMSCPLGMARMTYPARSSTCDHLQCFDVDTYLRMNEKKPKWNCPVCNKAAHFENLFLDGFYIQLLQSPQFRALSTNDIVLNQDATWEPVVSEGVGVSDDSEDEDPLSLPTPAKTTLTLEDPDIIPITPDVDSDGAPILAQLATLPIAPRANAFTNGINKPAADEDFLHDVDLPPEDDYVDWNFSVKFFQFLRNPPKRLEPSLPAEKNAEPLIVTSEPRPDSPPLLATKTKPTKIRVPVTSKPRGGRGSRGRPRGGSASKPKRVYDSEDLDYSSDEPKAKAKKGGGRASRGRGGGAAKRSRYVESSAEEESSESEEEVLARPVVSATGRPSRNCRRSTNYADIEKAGDMLDYFLN